MAWVNVRHIHCRDYLTGDLVWKAVPTVCISVRHRVKWAHAIVVLKKWAHAIVDLKKRTVHACCYCNAVFAPPPPPPTLNDLIAAHAGLACMLA